jgi:hypothetical protein
MLVIYLEPSYKNPGNKKAPRVHRGANQPTYRGRIGPFQAPLFNILIFFSFIFKVVDEK